MLLDCSAAFATPSFLSLQFAIVFFSWTWYSLDPYIESCRLAVKPSDDLPLTVAQFNCAQTPDSTTSARLSPKAGIDAG
jgi:hypothetical protein